MCRLAPSRLAQAASEEAPNDFYIVASSTSDADPFWSEDILDVEGNGSGSTVRYIRIAPLGPPCDSAVAVNAATVHLSGLSPSDLIRDGNLCAVDTDSINRQLRRRIRTAEVDDSVRYGIAANCGSRSVALQLPYPEQVKLDRLRKTAPQLARWWDVFGSVEERAFGSAKVFQPSDAEGVERLRQEGRAVVPYLLSGRFNAGLEMPCQAAKLCASPSLVAQLQVYVDPSNALVPPGQLIHPEQYRFDRYVPPRYPVLAVDARLSGTVLVNLTVRTNTGEVRDLVIRAGHPVFAKEVTYALKQWKFSPEGLRGTGEELTQIPIELKFDWTCPKPAKRE